MKKLNLNKTPVIIVLIIISLISAYVVNIAGPEQPRTVIVEGDGCGHFDYLPAWFVFGSVDFKPVFEKEKERHDGSYMGHYFHKLENGVFINKYTSGTALMIMPFYLLALLLSPLFGLPRDGFGLLFQYSVVAAGIFWLITGLWFFTRLLRQYGISRFYSLVYALLLLFGTNLFHYAFVAPAFSHVYSFALITILLYNLSLFFRSPGKSRLFLSSFVYGLIVLVRPVNAVVLLALPFMASSRQQFLSGMRYLFKPLNLIVSVLLVLAALSPQIIVSLLQAGKLWVNGYIDEGFYFLHPHIPDFLFSFRKGWFIYTPLMLLLFPAFLFLYKKQRFNFWVLTGFFVIQVYLFSAWWNWFYGDSFGMRPMVDYYGLYFLPVVLFINNIKKPKRQIAVAIPVLFFVFLNLFQTYQYAEGIIHPDAMNRKAWAYVFLKSDSKYKHIVGDCDESFYGTLGKKPLLSVKYTRDGTARGWSDTRVHVKDPVGSGKMVTVINQRYKFSPTYVQRLPDSLVDKKNLYAYFKCDYLEPIAGEAGYARFVVNVRNRTGKKSLFYKAFPLKRLPDSLTNRWRHTEIGFRLPVIKEKDAIIKYYIWYRGIHLMYLDNLRLDIYSYR